jgi:hypothetical protein
MGWNSSLKRIKTTKIKNRLMGEKNMFTNKFVKTIGLLLGLWSLNSQGSAIYYRTIDLDNTNPAEDLWRYEYQIADATFQKDGGFDIYFPADNPYQPGDLVLTEAANLKWDVNAYQPEPALPKPHDGFLDGMWLGDTPLVLPVDPSLQWLFYIDFIWRGSGIPASQRYELYDDSFAVTDSGQTQPFPTTSVPEPEALLLLLVGLGGYLVKHKRVNGARCAP